MNEQINENQIKILELQVNQYKYEIEQLQKKNDEYLRIMDNLSIIINTKLCNDDYAKDFDKIDFDAFVKKEDLTILQEGLIMAQEEIEELKAEFDKIRAETSSDQPSGHVSNQPVNHAGVKQDYNSFNDFHSIRSALANNGPKPVKITPHYATTMPSGTTSEAQPQKQGVNKQNQKGNEAANNQEIKSGMAFSFLKRKE